VPPQFTFGDIESICRRLGLSKAQKGSMLWLGVGPDGQYRQTTMHSYGDGTTVSPSTAKKMAEQLKFKDVDDMYDFLNNRHRKS
jgi:hypothetical protein